MRHYLFISICLFFSELVVAQSARPAKPGKERWFCQMQIQDKAIDFFLEQRATRIFPPQFRIWNGRETIDLNFGRVEGDSVVYPISIYDSELRLPLKMGSDFAGRYVKNDTKVPGYFLPFVAKKEMAIPPNRFFTFKPVLPGNWSLEFLENGLITDTGFGVFTQSGDSIYGSILTETGDYRYLNGRQLDRESGYFQSFNGAQTYRFEWVGDGSMISGTFYINKTRRISFRGLKTDRNPLSDGFSKSRGKPMEKFRFRARDLKGNWVDEQLPLVRDKALVVQVLGSWCPNCLDETRFLTEQFPNRPAGVEFIGLAFERKSEFDYAKTRVETVINRLNPAYPIWIGGISNKDSAAAVFPAITGIAAFPTTIFVKANGQVHKVHTGFSGPATGAYYDAWKKEFAELLHEITNP